jgi:hypothetical protein
VAPLTAASECVCLIPALSRVKEMGRIGSLMVCGSCHVAGLGASV